MPRVSTVKTEEENTAPKKRAPRKRVTSLDDDAVVPRPRTRRAAPKRVAAIETEEVRVDEEPVRRAPTPLRAERQAAKHSSKILVIASIILFVFSGVGIAIGMSDRGAIDVVAVVNERNEKIGRGEVRDGNNEAVTQTVPVQNTDARPNGGLVPMDPADVPTPPVATPEVATTTEEVATTTDSTDITEDEAETEVVADEAVTDSVE